METLDKAYTVTELAEIVRNMYENTTPPPVPTFDKVAEALGVDKACTGNPDTAELSTEHTPKKGLSVRFYTAAPGYRSEKFVMNCYYVAQWNGTQYRGHVVMSTQGYHADNALGFVCFDLSAYTDTLPQGCRKLVAELVTSAVIASGVNLADLVAEKAADSRHYAIQAELWEAVKGLEDAVRAEKAVY